MWSLKPILKVVKSNKAVNLDQRGRFFYQIKNSLELNFACSDMEKMKQHHTNLADLRQQIVTRL